MSKRKRGSQPSPGKENPPTGADEGDPMVHVSSDVLAGSPDVFSKRSDEPSEPAPAMSDEPSSSEVDQPAQTPEVASAEEPPPAPMTSPMEEAPPPPSYVPPVSSMHAPRARRVGSSVALGVMLVVVGLFFLIVRVFDIDLSTYGWPLFIIIPGLTLIVVGFVSLGTGALIPGGIITMTGLILAYQSSSGDWAAWAYAWPLVAPFGVGVGIYLQGLRDRNVRLLKQGRTLMFIALLIFMIGFVLFETILNISGIDYGWFGKAALPALLIVIGAVLLMRSVQSSRQA